MISMLQQQLYKIPICHIMKHDLSKLCNQMVILAEVHELYNTLPTSARAVDTLPASTIDDSGDDGDNTLI